jgi:hypothetical protein
VPDWSGLDGTATAARYRQQAEETRHHSPSYRALCLAVADDPQVLARLDSLPAPKRQPNLLLAAVRFLDGPVDTYPPFREFVLDQWDELAATMRARRTQTNEPRRCTAFLPVLAALPQPLALLEVGASAGLCLFPDRYQYRYASERGEHRIGAGPVELHCGISGAVPLPERLPQIVWRRGLDLHPLEVCDDEDVRWLRSLVWPEQRDRFQILSAAVALARDDPPQIVRGDMLDDLSAVAGEAPASATLVVLHSAALAYVAAADRPTFAAEVAQLAGSRPTVWLSNEAPGVVEGTAVDTGGRSLFVLARDTHPVALTGPHGHTLDWL